MSVEYMDDLLVPAVPPNTVRESNLETVRRLEQDLDGISNSRLTALDAYRLYWYRNGIHSCWGYCLEAARNITTNEICVLFRNDEGVSTVKALRWLPLSALSTRQQAQRLYQVQYVGPTEDVLYGALEIFRDIFVYATAVTWSYGQRLQFYYFFPFENLTTVEEVIAFRVTLLSRPIYLDYHQSFPDYE
jgi:hypothetical protein